MDSKHDRTTTPATRTAERAGGHGASRVKPSSGGSAPRKARASAEVRGHAPRATAERAAQPGRAPGTPEAPTAQTWHTMVAEAAYFRAQRRGFSGGSAEQDWLEAEAELRRDMIESGG